MILVLFSYGCTMGGKGPSSTISEEEVYKGTEGLGMSFMRNAPPDIIYENEMFPLNIEIENKGAYDIKKGYITVGFDKENPILSIDRGSEKEYFDLNGRSIGNPAGERDVVGFYLRSKLFSGTETMSYLLRINSNYRYQTKAVENVCVDTDVYKQKEVGRDKACEAKEIILSKGQGAPVAVTKIEPVMKHIDESSIKPTFKIYIKNVGKGDVHGLRDDKIDAVSVSAYLAETELDCGEYTDAFDIGKHESIRCSLESGVSKDWASFSSLLMVYIDYTYSDTISKSMEVRKEI